MSRSPGLRLASAPCAVQSSIFLNGNAADTTLALGHRIQPDSSHCCATWRNEIKARDRAIDATRQPVSEEDRHGANVVLTTAPGDQSMQQFLDVGAVGLHPPSVAGDPQARRIHDQTIDAALLEESEFIITRLKRDIQL